MGEYFYLMYNNIIFWGDPIKEILTRLGDGGSDIFLNPDDTAVYLFKLSMHTCLNCPW